MVCDENKEFAVSMQRLEFIEHQVGGIHSEQREQVAPLIYKDDEGRDTENTPEGRLEQVRHVLLLPVSADEMVRRISEILQ